MSSTKNAPAGWYPDTAAPGTDRYWDGDAWTFQTRTSMPVAPAPTHTQGPMLHNKLDVKREVIYTRQQKGHSIVLHVLLGFAVLWINVIYISASPNHHWHI